MKKKLAFTFLILILNFAKTHTNTLSRDALFEFILLIKNCDINQNTKTKLMNETSINKLINILKNYDNETSSSTKEKISDMIAFLRGEALVLWKDQPTIWIKSKNYFGKLEKCISMKLNKLIKQNPEFATRLKKN